MQPPINSIYSTGQKIYLGPVSKPFPKVQDLQKVHYETIHPVQPVQVFKKEKVSLQSISSSSYMNSVGSKKVINFGQSLSSDTYIKQHNEEFIAYKQVKSIPHLNNKVPTIFEMPKTPSPYTTRFLPQPPTQSQMIVIQRQPQLSHQIGYLDQEMQKKKKSKKSKGVSPEQFVQNLHHQIKQNQKSIGNVAEIWTLDIVQEFAQQCSLNQKCSKFIQDRLAMKIEEGERKRFVEKLLKGDVIQMITDQNGNYVIQKVIISSDQDEQLMLFSRIQGSILELSTDKHGCRVLQTCFQVFEKEIQLQMLEELQGNIVTCCYDYHANHVIQKIFLHMGQEQEIQKLIKEIASDVINLCKHEQGCRVIQRILEHKNNEKLINQILQSYDELTQDQFGTFVLCSALDNGNDDQVELILKKVSQKAPQMCIDRDGSKLLENCIKMIGTCSPHLEALQQQILADIVNLPFREEEKDQLADISPKIFINDLLQGKFANYVVQRIYQKSSELQKAKIIQDVKKTLAMVTNLENSPLRHIIIFLETKCDITRQQIESNEYITTA